MGNTEGVLTCQDKNLTPVPFHTYNPTLGCNILTQYTTSSSIPSIKKGKLLYSTINNHNQILLVNSHAAESYDIVSGNCVRKFEPPKAVYVVAASVCGNNLILAYNTWILQLLDSETLQEVRQIVPEEIPGTITCFKATETELIAGHSSSSMTVWKLPSFDTHLTYSPITAEGPVTCVSYSARHRTYLAACDMMSSSSQDQFILYAYTKNSATRKLQGSLGRCLSISVLDKRNLVIGLSDRKLIILWDIIIGSPIPYSLPNFMPQFRCTSLISFEYTNITVIGLGMSNNSIALAELGYSEEEMKFDIDWKVNAVQKGVGDVSFMDVREDLDCLVFGNTLSQAFIFNNLEVITRIQPKSDLPIFSLQHFEVQKKEVAKKSDLPLFSIGIPNIKMPNQIPFIAPLLSSIQTSTNSTVPVEETKSNTIELKDKASPKIPSTVANEETVRKIRERIEGKKSSVNIEISTKLPKEDKETVSNTQLQEEENTLQNNNEKIPYSDQVIEESKPNQEEMNITQNDSRSPSQPDTEESKSSTIKEPQSEAPARSISKKLTPFEKFFKEKRQEILKEDETLLQREIVMRVTKLWAGLSEEERAEYEVDDGMTS